MICVNILLLCDQKDSKGLETQTAGLGLDSGLACLDLGLDSGLEGKDLRLTWDLQKNDLVPPLALSKLKGSQHAWCVNSTISLYSSLAYGAAGLRSQTASDTTSEPDKFCAILTPRPDTNGADT